MPQACVHTARAHLYRQSVYSGLCGPGQGREMLVTARLPYHFMGKRCSRTTRPRWTAASWLEWGTCHRKVSSSIHMSVFSGVRAACTIRGTKLQPITLRVSASHRTIEAIGRLSRCLARRPQITCCAEETRAAAPADGRICTSFDGIVDVWRLPWTEPPTSALRMRSLPRAHRRWPYTLPSCPPPLQR